MKRYYKKHKKSLIFFLLSAVASSLCWVSGSFLMGAFAEAATSGKMNLAWKLAAVTAVYICIDAFLDHLPRYRKDILIQQIGRDLRRDVVQKIEALPYEVKQAKDDGDWLSMIANDIPTIQEEYLSSIGGNVVQVCSFCLGVTAAFYIQPAMTVIMLTVSILPVIFPKVTEKKLQQVKEEEQKAKSAYLSSVTQIFKGFFLLKTFRGFSGINRTHDGENEKLLCKTVRSRKILSLLYSGAYGCGSAIYLGTWVLGLFFVSKGRIDLPLLITFSNLMSNVAGPIQIITERYAMTTAASAVCKRVLAFLDEDTEEASHWGTAPLTAINQVTLSGLSYRTEDKQLLRATDLTLRKGDRVALLGESGSGKSTLLKLLSAMYTGQGEYDLNGRPCRDFSYEDFRSQVTLLQQKSFVFDGGIRDNVTMFAPEPSDSQVVSALKTARLGQWYQERGGSPEVIIGAEARSLSGGEERRLDLARCLYRRASLVMLDEPTTGLDADTRREVEDVIARLDCGILVVAMHEYSPEFLQSFNRVLTMEEGVLREI